MSPLVSALHLIRMQHGICQLVLADMSGYEQTYFSALEVGKKRSPTQEFVENLNLSGE